MYRERVRRGREIWRIRGSEVKACARVGTGIFFRFPAWVLFHDPEVDMFLNNG